jgi:hypothetical protein
MYVSPPNNGFVTFELNSNVGEAIVEVLARYNDRPWLLRVRQARAVIYLLGIVDLPDIETPITTEFTSSGACLSFTVDLPAAREVQSRVEAAQAVPISVPRTAHLFHRLRVAISRYLSECRDYRITRARTSSATRDDRTSASHWGLSGFAGAVPSGSRPAMNAS